MADALIANLHAALRDYAAAVTAQFKGTIRGEPEDALREPFARLMQTAGAALDTPLGVRGEVRLPGIGKPDYGITTADGNLTHGYAELKAPGGGVLRKDLDARSKKQFDRFVTLGNLLYCDGNRFALYQNEKKAGHLLARRRPHDRRPRRGRRR